MQGEKSRYQLHTWEVLQFPINKVLLLQVPIPQEQREELQEVRKGHSSDEVYESTWSEGPKHSYVS